MLKKIKAFIIKLLGGYTEHEYWDSVNKLNKGFVCYQSVIYDPVCVTARRGITPRMVIDCVNVPTLMVGEEQAVVLDLLDCIKNSDAISVKRNENRLGDIELEASIKILMPVNKMEDKK